MKHPDKGLGLILASCVVTLDNVYIKQLWGGVLLSCYRTIYVFGWTSFLDLQNIKTVYIEGWLLSFLSGFSPEQWRCFFPTHPGCLLDTCYIWTLLWFLAITSSGKRNLKDGMCPSAAALLMYLDIEVPSLNWVWSLKSSHFWLKDKPQFICWSINQKHAVLFCSICKIDVNTFKSIVAMNFGLSSCKGKKMILLLVETNRKLASIELERIWSGFSSLWFKWNILACP